MGNKKYPKKDRACKNCFKVQSIATNRMYCNPCNSKITYREELEKGLETQPWKYVECSNCMEIWTLKKKKLVNGKREGFRYEEYKRSDCPNCNSVALQFLNNGKLNMSILKKQQKEKEKEEKKMEKFKSLRKKMNERDEFSFSMNDVWEISGWATKDYYQWLDNGDIYEPYGEMEMSSERKWNRYF